MERQAGLGRSLEDVLHALTPVDPDPSSPSRQLFERDLEQQLDQLANDIGALRDRLQHLETVVAGAAVGLTEKTKKNKDNKKKKRKHADAKRNGSGAKKTK